jgi:CheY-like chemotaxis protein/anti-sigma regulatory factor (Ser/Thr protein kinase)
MSASKQADSAQGTPSTPTVLVVDDSPIDQHLAGSLIQKEGGWNAAFAANGVEALKILTEKPPDLVLTDMLMPEMDGLELVKAIRSDHPTVPVILMTAHGSEEIAIQALKSGAASYVPKQTLSRDLVETIDQVLAVAQTKLRGKRILERLDYFENRFILDNDTALIPSLVSHLEEDLTRLKLCEPSGLVLLGVALHEALTNAILHGNLELDSALREADEKEYYRQSVQRRALEPFSARRVHVTTRFTQQELAFVVRDEGQGFDPETLPDPTDPKNLGKVSGRGLLLIRTFMDQVDHNDIGNEITMIKRVMR